MANTKILNETIRTGRLRLEAFDDRHLNETLVGWLNDPEVTRFSEQRHKVHTLASSRTYYESYTGSPNHYWAIMADGSMIGTITSYVDEFNLVADVGILVGNKEYWGSGYGSEAFRAVVNWLFRSRGMRKVTAGTMDQNSAMIQVMLNSGMHVEGRRERYFLLDGQEVDFVYGTVFSEDWDNICNRKKKVE